MKALLNIVVAIALLAFIAFFGKQFLDNKEFNDAHNTGIDMMNAGNHGDASTHFEILIDKYKDQPDRVASLKEMLVKCYRALARDPALNIKRQQAVLKKIEEVDPSLLSEREKKILSMK